MPFKSYAKKLEYGKKYYYRRSDIHRERKYGVTPEMYDAKLKAQGGLCIICRLPPDGKIKTLAVDHDHEHGKLRDLLCHRCNLLLGLAKDHPDILLEAATYLKRWKLKFLFGE